MGLFDTIICEHPLPLPELDELDVKEIKQSLGVEGDVNWKTVEWQTKSLENVLDTYTIEDDGQVYRAKTEWVEDENSPGGYVPTEDSELEKYEGTTEIDFYQAFLGESNDYWLEFKCVVFKGEVKEMDLIEFKREDNAERKEMQEKLKQAFVSTRTPNKNSKIYKAYRFCIVKPLGLLRAISNFVTNMTLRVERWLP